MIPTTLYGFLKPEATDSADLRIFVGSNMDLIEEKISDIESIMLVDVDWADITGKPTTFFPTAHTHAWTEITGKPTLDNYQGWNVKVGETTDLITSWQTVTFASTGQTTLGYNATTNILTISTPIATDIYLTGITGSGNGTVTFTRNGTTQLTWDSSHTHNWDNITLKPTTFTPSAHTHLWTDITDRPSAFNPVAHTHLWGEISDKPTTFPATIHTHSWNDVTDKPTTFIPPLASNTTLGGVKIGNGLIMVDENLHLNLGIGLSFSGTSVQLDKGDYVPTTGNTTITGNISVTGELTQNNGRKVIQQSATAGTGAITNIWTGTQVQFDGIGAKDSSTIYYIVG